MVLVVLLYLGRNQCLVSLRSQRLRLVSLHSVRQLSLPHLPLLPLQLLGGLFLVKLPPLPPLPPQRQQDLEVLFLAKLLHLLPQPLLDLSLEVRLLPVYLEELHRPSLQLLLLFLVALFLVNPRNPLPHLDKHNLQSLGKQPNPLPPLDKHRNQSLPLDKPHNLHLHLDRAHNPHLPLGKRHSPLPHLDNPPPPSDKLRNPHRHSDKLQYLAKHPYLGRGQPHPQEGVCSEGRSPFLVRPLLSLVVLALLLVAPPLLPSPLLLLPLLPAPKSLRKPRTPLCGQCASNIVLFVTFIRLKIYKYIQAYIIYNVHYAFPSNSFSAMAYISSISFANRCNTTRLSGY